MLGGVRASKMTALVVDVASRARTLRFIAGGDVAVRAQHQRVGLDADCCAGAATECWVAWS